MNKQNKQDFEGEKTGGFPAGNDRECVRCGYQPRYMVFKNLNDKQYYCLPCRNDIIDE